MTPAQVRIALALAILQGGRPHDDHTARLAAAALTGADLGDLTVMDVVGFDVAEEAA